MSNRMWFESTVLRKREIKFIFLFLYYPYLYTQMLKGRFQLQEKLRDHSDVGIYGIFDTEKVLWKYYVISFENKGNTFYLTSELCPFYEKATYDTVKRQGKEFKTCEEAREWILDYKTKWESGSNNTTEEIRDKKLGDLGI